MNRSVFLGTAWVGTFGLLAIPAPARASNTVDTYSDGVGVVDPYGRSLLRVRFDNTLRTIKASVPSASWTTGEFPPIPSYFYVHRCFFSIRQSDPTHLVMRVRLPNGGVIFVGVNIDPNQTLHPVSAAIIPGGPTQTIGYMPNFQPNKNPGGPNPNDAIGCIAAWFAVVSASVAVAGALAACIGAPELEPADLWALAQAVTAWAAANALEQQQC